MKKNLVYTIDSDTMYISRKGLVGCRYMVQHVTFTKHAKDGEDIIHHACIVANVDIKRKKGKNSVTVNQ